MLQTAGITMYAASISFKAYETPTLLPFLMMIAVVFFAFGDLFIALNSPYYARFKTQLWLLATIVVTVLSNLMLPLMVNVINDLIVILLVLLFILPAQFTNEWGLLSMALLFSALVPSFFLLSHQYLPLAAVKAMLLPFLCYGYFFKAHFVTVKWSGTVGLLGVLIVLALFMTESAILMIIVTIVCLIIWFLLTRQLSQTSNRFLLLSSCFTAIVLILNR
ncbi:hypothetical protein AYR62_07520 [Secundilactobacillus paracollinoides]|nr:hypothetical protein [Secundilactobacillus paracollinoides]ANZ63951.1 hypothetical protein AYR62_07520 [Secundilactobacillus paracollinoides]